MPDRVVVRFENHTPLAWRLLYVWDWIWTRILRRRLKVQRRHLPRPTDVLIDGEAGKVASVQFTDREVVLGLSGPFGAWEAGDTVEFTIGEGEDDD